MSSRKLVAVFTRWRWKMLVRSCNVWYSTAWQMKEAEENNAASLIQRITRGWLSRKFVKRKRFNLAATEIQKIVRGFVARRHAGQAKSKLAQDKAAVVIQSNARVFLVQRKTRAIREERKIEHGAKVIQRITRGRKGRLEAHKVRMEKARNQAALVVQRAAKQKLAWKRRKTRIQYLAAVKVQSAIRKELARAKVAEMKIQKASAIKIQKVARGKHARNAYKNILQQKQEHEAAIKVQSIVRGHLGRKTFKEKKYHELKRKSEARSAVEVQRVWRGRKDRTRVHAQIKEQKQASAAVKIQSMHRGHRARAQVQQLLQQRQDAQIFQRNEEEENYEEDAWIYNEQRPGKSGGNDYDNAVKDATNIQRLFRGFQARKLVQEKKQRDTSAAISIQSAMRGHFGRNKAKAATLDKYISKLPKIESYEAAIRIQALQRGRAARQKISQMDTINEDPMKDKIYYPSEELDAEEVEEELEMEECSSSSSSSSEFEEVHKDVEDEFRMHTASSKIQALQRGRAARQYALELREKKEAQKRLENQSALRIQALHRGSLARAELESQHKAATRIQAQARRKIALSMVNDERALLRARSQELELQRQARQKEEAALKIQKNARGFVTRKKEIRRSAEHRRSLAKIEETAKREAEQIRQLAMNFDSGSFKSDTSDVHENESVGTSSKEYSVKIDLSHSRTNKQAVITPADFMKNVLPSFSGLSHDQSELSEDDKSEVSQVGSDYGQNDEKSQTSTKDEPKNNKDDMFSDTAKDMYKQGQNSCLSFGSVSELGQNSCLSFESVNSMQERWSDMSVASEDLNVQLHIPFLQDRSRSNPGLSSYAKSTSPKSSPKSSFHPGSSQKKMHSKEKKAPMSPSYLDVLKEDSLENLNQSGLIPSASKTASVSKFYPHQMEHLPNEQNGSPPSSQVAPPNQLQSHPKKTPQPVRNAHSSSDVPLTSGNHARSPSSSTSKFTENLQDATALSTNETADFGKEDNEEDLEEKKLLLQIEKEHEAKMREMAEKLKAAEEEAFLIKKAQKEEMLRKKIEKIKKEEEAMNRKIAAAELEKKKALEIKKKKQQERAAITIQKAARGKQARSHVQKIRCEFIQRNHQQHQAAIKVQKIARGKLARNRVKQIRHTMLERKRAQNLMASGHSGQSKGFHPPRSHKNNDLLSSQNSSKNFIFFPPMNMNNEQLRDNQPAPAPQQKPMQELAEHTLPKEPDQHGKTVNFPEEAEPKTFSTLNASVHEEDILPKQAVGVYDDEEEESEEEAEAEAAVVVGASLKQETPTVDHKEVDQLKYRLEALEKLLQLQQQTHQHSPSPEEFHTQDAAQQEHNEQSEHLHLETPSLESIPEGNSFGLFDSPSPITVSPAASQRMAPEPVPEHESDMEQAPMTSVFASDASQSGWKEYWDEAAQRYYWFNEETQETSWTNPGHSYDSEGYETTGSVMSYETDNHEFQSDTAINNWVEYYDDHAESSYWYNTATGEASWIDPNAASFHSQGSSSQNNIGNHQTDHSRSENEGALASYAPDDYTNAWESYIDESSGLSYWYNHITGETSWET